jgi:hypothetical protein
MSDNTTRYLSFPTAVDALTAVEREAGGPDSANARRLILDDAQLAGELPHVASMRRALARVTWADWGEWAQYVSPTATVAVGSVAAPSHLTKTLRVPYAETVPLLSSYAWVYGNQGPWVTPADNSTAALAIVGTLVLPAGVTITAVRARMHRSAVGDLAEFVFYRGNNDDTQSILSTLTHSTTGWQTVSAVLNELTSELKQYFYTVVLQKAAAATPNTVRYQWMEVDYNMPDYSRAI